MSRVLESAALSDLMQRVMQLEPLSPDEVLAEREQANRVIMRARGVTGAYRQALLTEAAGMLLEIVRADRGGARPAPATGAGAGART